MVKITDGYSGADIANVCRDAAMMPLRKKIAEGNFNINEIKGFSKDINVPLKMQDFLDALKNVSKSVSQAQLDDYARWMAEFGSV